MNGRIVPIATLVFACAGCASTSPVTSKLASIASTERTNGPHRAKASQTLDREAEVPCALLAFDIGVSGDGGIFLTYVAVPGLEERLRSDIRERARHHNARTHGAIPDSPAAQAALSTVALPAPTKDGIRVTLLPGAGNDTAELFANTEFFAPELVPSENDLSCASNERRLTRLEGKILPQI